jgi:hypothetical protein
MTSKKKSLTVRFWRESQNEPCTSSANASIAEGDISELNKQGNAINCLARWFYLLFENSVMF